MGFTQSDNATNNDTLVKHLASELNYAFDEAKSNNCFHPIENRVCCCQHSFHISASAATKVLQAKTLYLGFQLEGQVPEGVTLEELWEEELQKPNPNVVIKARKLAYVVGVSSQQ